MFGIYFVTCIPLSVSNGVYRKASYQQEKGFSCPGNRNVFGSVTNHHAVVINEKIVSFGTYYSKVTAWDGTLDGSRFMTVWDVKFAEPTNTQD